LLKLTKTSLYTIALPEALFASGDGTATWRARQRFVAASRALQDAQAQGMDMPVVVANSQTTDEIIGWGRLDEVAMDADGTTLLISQMMPVQGHRKTELRLVSTGRRIATGFRRPYAIVQTPAFIARAARPPKAAKGASAPVPAPATEVADLPAGITEFPAHNEPSDQTPFQHWCRAHADGYVLTSLTESRALLLSVRCAHIGRLHFTVDAITPRAPRRLCGDSAELLRSWAQSSGVRIDTCRQCEREARQTVAGSVPETTDRGSAMLNMREAEEEAEVTRIQQRADIGPTEKTDLIRARRGQGRYRDNLEKIESACRVTGVLDRRHLLASHIKPWCRSDDREKLDGYNGLLFSPHVGHLFDRGYISFTDAGDMLVSAQMNEIVLSTWRLKAGQKVGAFRPEQGRFLAYHREHVFGKEEGGRRAKK
jgi:hypothetical protein